MNAEQFWQIIECTRVASKGNNEQEKALQDELARLAPEQIVDFKLMYETMLDRAYTWDLWGVAYIVHGGCSDDGFIDFRSWLISMGKETFERALTSAESLVEVIGPDDYPEFESFRYAADKAYEKKTGKRMDFHRPASPAEPAGQPWEESDECLQERFPSAFAKFAESDS